jgi:hypothetical protein
MLLLPRITRAHAFGFWKLARLRREFTAQVEAAGIECDRSERGNFLMSAQEYRLQAALFRRIGLRRFGLHHDNLGRAVEHRLKRQWRP